MNQRISWDVYLEEHVTRGVLMCVNGGGGVGRGLVS